jgi:hypothetical protein
LNPPQRERLPRFEAGIPMINKVEPIIIIPTKVGLDFKT